MFTNELSTLKLLDRSSQNFYKRHHLRC